jgi:hypothetical protein
MHTILHNSYLTLIREFSLKMIYNVNNYIGNHTTFAPTMHLIIFHNNFINAQLIFIMNHNAHCH